MKSYKDKRIIVGLLALALFAGGAGRFFESTHFSFPKTNDLGQAAAILATQENIVGAKTPEALPDTSLAIVRSKKLQTTEDIVLAPAGCVNRSFEIFAHESYTVGFLCLSIKAGDFDTQIQNATGKANVLVVAIDAPDTAFADRAQKAGALMTVSYSEKDVWVYTKDTTLHAPKVHVEISKNTITEVSK